MKKSFRDPITGVLTAWGYAESNNDHIARDESDGFVLEPGKWRFVAGEWIPHDTVAMPRSVTPLQARRALLNRGLLDALEEVIGMADMETRLAWRYATAVERNSPFVAAMAAALNLTGEQIDDLFVYAASL